MDRLLQLLEKADSRNQQDIIDQIAAEVENGPDLEQRHVSSLVDQMTTWLKSSNIKVRLVSHALLRKCGDYDQRTRWLGTTAELSFSPEKLWRDSSLASPGRKDWF